MNSESANLVQQAWSALAAGDHTASADLSGRAIAGGCGGPGAYHVLALARWSQGDKTTALTLLTKAAEISDGDPRVCSDLGVLRYAHHDWAGALEAFAECLRIDPADSTALQGYAESLLQMGRYEEARQAAETWDRAVTADAKPPYLTAQCLDYEGRLDEAAREAERSLERDPDSWRTLTLLASIRQKQAHYALCLKHTRKAAQLLPDSASAQARLALACWDIGDLDGALAARERALELGLADRNLAQSLTWLTLHDPRQTASSLLEIHRKAARELGSAAAPPSYANNRDPERRLRVGYLSGEFVSNPAFCFLGWLRHHDPKQVETFYYMSRPFQDTHTAGYRSQADHWRDVFRVSDDDLVCRMIRDDQIDILVDLSGHFDFNRLGVFAKRPAPVQAAFPNYPGTTGLDAIDYLLTDIWTAPAGCENESTEKPYRLPSGCLVYKAPPDEMAPVSALPALSNGYVTFGLFQRPGKLHAAVWDAIAQTLSAVPNSRLLVHSGSCDLDVEGSEQRARVLQPLERRGIPAGRVLFRGSRPTEQHFAVVAEADIALDTFPYNGQTTTCDCLWIGVPVVSLRGAAYVSRVTPALLERIGLGDLAADSLDGYVRRAIDLAGDIDKLAAFRSSLRERMKKSSLTDNIRLAAEIEAAYREMWRSWCAQSASSQSRKP